MEGILDTRNSERDGKYRGQYQRHLGGLGISQVETSTTSHLAVNGPVCDGSEDSLESLGATDNDEKGRGYGVTEKALLRRVVGVRTVTALALDSPRGQGEPAAKTAEQPLARRSTLDDDMLGGIYPRVERKCVI